MQNKVGVLARALIIFVAVFALLVAYFWVHRPFGIQPGGGFPQTPLRLGGALIDLLTASAIFAAAGGIGRAMLARFDLTPLSRAERVALEGGIGLGAVAIGALFLGLIGLYRGAVLWIVLIAAAIVTRHAVTGWLRDSVALVKSVRADGAWNGFIAIFAGVLLLLALLTALAPPVSWDGMTYHLIAPTRYLAEGRIAAHPDNFYIGLSQNVEMLYGMTIGLFGRDTAAAPIHFGIGLLALAATAGLTRRYAGRSAAWLTILLLLSAYSFWALFGWSYVDLALMLYGALALIAALTWRDQRADGWIILMGVVVGLAMGVKYTAAALGVVLGLFLLINEPRRVVRNALLLTIPALIAFLPWMIKGVALYGNPVYPFLFDGLNWDAGRATAFSFADRSLTALDRGWQIPILPLAATIFGDGNSDGFGFTAGPWLLTSFLLLPLVWECLESKARRLASGALMILIPLILFWMVLSAWSAVGTQTRLMLMSFPAFAAGGALGLTGLARFPKKPIDIHFIVRVLLILTTALALVEAVHSTVRDQVVSYLFGETPLDDYMYTNTGAYYGALRQLDTLPDGSQVRLMWEPRTYYCPDDIRCVPDILFDSWVRPMLYGADADGVFEQYRDSGDDYLLFFHAGYDLYTAFSHYAALERLFPETIERWMTPIWTDGVRYTLYAWRDATPGK